MLTSHNAVTSFILEKMSCHDEHFDLTGNCRWGAREIESHVVVFESGAAALLGGPSAGEVVKSLNISVSAMPSI